MFKVFGNSLASGSKLGSAGSSQIKLQKLTARFIASIPTVFRAVTAPGLWNTLCVRGARPLELPALHWRLLTVLSHMGKSVKWVYNNKMNPVPLITCFWSCNTHLLICAILAVHLSVTHPLVQQTLLALRTAAFRAARRRFRAVLLVRMISAVRVSIAAHTDRQALTAAALPLRTAATLLTYRTGDGKRAFKSMGEKTTTLFSDCLSVMVCYCHDLVHKGWR